MAAGPLLVSEPLQRYRALGLAGDPVWRAAGQLRAAIGQRLSRTHADLLAVPEVDPTGQHIDWYAPFEGHVRRLAERVRGGPVGLAAALEHDDLVCFPHRVHTLSVAFGITPEAVLAECGRSIDEIDVYVPHQANKRIIDYAVGKLGVSPEKTVVNVDRYGNTSSGSIPLALADARADGRLTDGALVLMTGMGAGLTWGSALVEWTNGKGAA